MIKFVRIQFQAEKGIAHALPMSQLPKSKTQKLFPATKSLELWLPLYRVTQTLKISWDAKSMIWEKIILPWLIIAHLYQEKAESNSNQRRPKIAWNNDLSRLSKNFYYKQRNASAEGD